MKHVALLDILGTLTASQGFLAIGDVTDEVEIIDITHALVFFQGLQINAVLTHQVYYLCFSLGSIPVIDKVSKVGIRVVDVLAGIVGDVFRA